MYQIIMPKNYNQTFSASIDGKMIDFDMSVFHDVCYMTIAIDGETIITSAKCTPNSYLFTNEVGMRLGNLAFICYGGEYPHPDNFNDNCKLYYITQEEFNKVLEEYNNTKTSKYLKNYTLFFG